MSSPCCMNVLARCSMSLSRSCCLKWAPTIAQRRHAVDHVDRQMEAVELVQHRHVERRRGRAFFLVAAHVHVVVIGAPVGQPVDQPRIAVEGEDHRLVAREQIESNSPSDRPCGCSLGGCSVIRSTTLTTRIFSSGRCSPQQIDRGQRLERRNVAGAGHHHIRLDARVVAGPFPDADARACNAAPPRP